MKRVVAILLCVSMLLTMSAFAVNEAHAAGLSNFTKKNDYPTGKFSDVAESAWYYDNVKGAYELGLVKGSGETTFNPNGSMTVAEALALACRIHSIYNTGKAEFVQGSPWYQVYLDYAVANQIIETVNDEGNVQFSAWNIAPEDKIYRSAFAYIFSKTLPEDEFEEINVIERVPDVGMGTGFEKPVLLLYRAGVLTGSDEYGMFNPATHINRAEVATIAARIVDKTKRKTLTLKAMEKSTLSCYEGTDIPDFGNLLHISAFIQNEKDGIRYNVYDASSILNSNHPQDCMLLYEKELLKNGYPLCSYTSNGSGGYYQVYENGRLSVLIGIAEDEEGEYLLVLFGLTETIFGE